MSSSPCYLVELLNITLEFLFKYESNISSNTCSYVSPVEAPVAVFSCYCVLQQQFAAITVCAV